MTSPNSTLNKPKKDNTEQSYVVLKEDCVLINKIVSYEDPYKKLQDYMVEESYSYFE